MKSYRKLQAKVIVLSIPSIICGALTPILVGKIVTMITEERTELLLQYFFAFIALLILTKCFDLLFNYHFNTLDEIISNCERKKLISKILNAKPNNTFALFLKEKIINRTMNEVSSLGTLYGLAPVMIVINVIMFIVALVVLAIIDFRLLIFTCIVIPLVYLLGNLLKKRMMVLSEREVKSYERLLLNITETVKGLSEIKIFKAQENVKAKLTKLSDELLECSKSKIFVARVYQDVQSILFSLLPILSLLVGFYLTSISKGTLGATLSFYLYVSYFIEPISNLSNARVMLFNAKKKAELVKELETEVEIVQGGTELLDNAKKLDIKYLAVDFEKVKLDKYLEICIESPGLYGFSADSGMGKSSLLKILSGLLFAPESEILISEKDVRKIDPNILTQKSCYVSGDSFIFAGTVQDNIELSSSLKLNLEALDFLFDTEEKITSSTILESEGANISLGQKQRIVILRLMSLLDKPEIIVLDEALSGVDETREIDILRKLKLHFAESIIILVTHRISSFSLCDKVFEL